MAVGKILEGLSDEEARDVRAIDQDAAIRRFVNRNPGALKPKSIDEYARRVAQVIAEFQSWATDPASYKPKGTTPTRRKDGSPSKPPRSTASSTQNRGIPTPPVAAPPPNPTGLSLHFPLRPDYLALVTVPRDITSDEARRLGAFLLTLAADYKPA